MRMSRLMASLLNLLSPRALLQPQISSNAPVSFLRNGFYATSKQQFIQAVETTAAQALRRRRGLFGLFLPIEVHFRFQGVNEFVCIPSSSFTTMGRVLMSLLIARSCFSK